MKILLWRFYWRHKDILGDMKNSFEDEEILVKTWRSYHGDSNGDMNTHSDI
jgi:hypothetical protein